MHEYRLRNELLLQLGFKDYRQYLRSPLWKEIRARKLKKDPWCYACHSKPSIQVHHSNYRLEVLQGKTLVGLYALCPRCHRWAEFTPKGEKRSPSEATKELIRMHRMYAYRARYRVDNRMKVIRKSIQIKKQTRRQTA